MTDELKPCPFCGGKTSFSTAKAAGYPFYVAECLDCKVLLLNLFKGELLTAWNRRDYSHIEVTDAMVEAGARAHCDHFGGEGWYSSGQAADSTEAMNAAMRLALTAALSVKEG